MIVARPQQVLKVLAVSLAGSVLAGGLLAAWGAGGEPPPTSLAETVPSDQPAPPASGVAASQPSQVDATDLAARRKLSSDLIGSPHDFSQNGVASRDLCLPCHTPHLVAPPIPLLDGRADTTPPLRSYQTADLELTGWSLLCLGCHDGDIASDVYSSVHAVTATDQLANSRLGVTGLRSHPVGIVYPVAGEGLQPRSAVESAGLLLSNGRIQCTTCHDAHNTHGYAGMLRISNERSRVCLTCHRR